MTSIYLIPDLQADEGLSLHAYPDPLSGAEPWTIGYGATGPDIGPNTVWTQEQALADLELRVAKLTETLHDTLNWFPTLADLRQDCLVNMGYNLGLHGLLAFHQTLTFIQQGHYDLAATAMLKSAWANQVGARAQRLSRQMLTGQHQP